MGDAGLIGARLIGSKFRGPVTVLAFFGRDGGVETPLIS